jgi:hypothetical protein
MKPKLLCRQTTDQTSRPLSPDPVTPRDIPPAVLGHMREFALEELGDLLAQLDAGNLILLDMYVEAQLDAETDRPTGVKTYTVMVRKS